MSSIPGHVASHRSACNRFKCGVVGVDPRVLRAGSEFDMFAQQVEDASQLAADVVARGGRMAMKVGAYPAGRIDDAFELDRELRSTPAFTSNLANAALYSGPYMTMTS